MGAAGGLERESRAESWVTTALLSSFRERGSECFLRIVFCWCSHDGGPSTLARKSRLCWWGRLRVRGRGH